MSQMLFDKAKDGDTTAAKIYLEYYLGKPQQSIDLNTKSEVEVNFVE